MPVNAASSAKVPVQVPGDVLAIYEGDKPKQVVGSAPPQLAVNIVLAVVGGGVGWFFGDKVYTMLGGDGKTLPIALVSLEDVQTLAAKPHVQFPLGHPQVRQVYARHPLHQAKFLHYAQFHQTIFMEKTTQAVKLLLALGAHKVTAKWSMDGGKKADADLSADLLKEVTGKGGWQRTSDDHFIFNVSGAGRASKLPSLPWRQKDPMFDTVIAAAQAGATHVDMILVSDRHSKVTAELGGSLVNNLKMHIGGSYGSWDRRSLSFSADF